MSESQAQTAPAEAETAQSSTPEKTTTPSEPVLSPSATEVTQETILDPNDVVSRRIQAYGRFEGKDSCGTCVSFGKFVPDDFAKRDTNVPVEFEHDSIDSEKGQAIAKEKNLEFIPYIKDCTTNRKGEEKCRELNEFNKKDWKKPSTQIS